MKKRGNLFAFVSAVLIVVVFAFPLVKADELNLAVNGALGGLSSDFRTVTDSDSNWNYDGFDLVAPTTPSNYSRFYSNVSENLLSVDVWSFNGSSRTINLIFDTNPAASGTLVLSWNYSSTEYNVTLKDYGTDSTYTTQVESDVNMRNSSSYSKSSTGTRYFTLTVIQNVVGTTAVPSSGGSSGGGGGGTVEEVKTFSLKIIHIGFISVDKKDKIKIPIEVVNDGQLNLVGIKLGVFVDPKLNGSRSITAALDIDEISSLASGESKNVTLTVNIDTDEEGEYNLNIQAQIDSLSYSDSSLIRISIKEGKKIKDKFIFIENLISENPECAEVKETVDEARLLFEERDFGAAEKKVNEAIYSCQRLLLKLQLKDFVYSNKTEIMIYTVAIVSVLSALIAYYYYRKARLMNGR
ncbi:MAG: CARDB domain-containing protein [Nanoarchaeota archaeon]